MLGVDLLHTGFIIFRYVPWIPDLSKAFYHKEVLDIVSGYLKIEWDDHMIFFFVFAY